MQALQKVSRPARRRVVQQACLVGVIAIGSLFVVPSAFAVDPPTPPTFRAANAYSGTAGGVAWFRSTDDIGVAGHEIIRDGRELGTFDTLSYINNGKALETAVAVSARFQESSEVSLVRAYDAVSYTIPWSDGLEFNAFSIKEVDVGIDD